MYVRIKNQETYNAGGSRNITKGVEEDLYEDVIRDSQFSGKSSHSL